MRHAVLLFDDGLNRLHVDLFGRCVEVLAGDGVDIVKGELPALALAVARLAGAALAKASSSRMLVPETSAMCLKCSSVRCPLSPP